ncbi:STAS domain-containing protein [Pontibacter pamirensis]|uniref:STAS domain-containing protein n=1 Tax=Pontibacter pamirensis TaxID=2562824 RepID=UPI00138A5B60|nr:STAS domain-containing protein [Pontibacter pamirensis]
MAIVVEHKGEYSLVLMKGSIEASDCFLLDNVLELTSLSAHKNMWIDFGDVAAVSTQALRIILALSTKAKSSGVNLVLYQMTASMRKTMKESRLDTVLLIVPSIADASRICESNRRS